MAAAEELVLVDSRRLTGPNLYADAAGAVAEVHMAGSVDPEAWCGRWREALEAGLAQLDWTAQIHVRVFEDPAGGHGAELMFTAAVDHLYAATELNEWAIARACANPGETTLTSIAEAAAIERGSRAGLLEVIESAERHEVAWLLDDEEFSLGYYARCQRWPLDALPRPEALDWSSFRAPAPLALVTGTNGKTTTTRMLARVARMQGVRVGNTSTDGLYVDERRVEAGDWTGPGGARAVLRNTQIEMSVLEAARGGLLRRGAGVRRCSVAVITNVAADHLGEYGIFDPQGMAAAKGIVARLVEAGGRVVLGADSRALVDWARGQTFTVPLVWFSLDEEQPELAAARAAGRECWTVGRGQLLRYEGEHCKSLCSVDSLPASLGGSALHNIQNALAAAAAARGLGFDDASIVAGLRSFGREASDNPGRARLETLALADGGQVELLLDFAHNLAGLEAIAALVAARGQTISLCFGMAGDRSDAELLELGAALARFAPARVILREQPSYLRGRPLGEVPARLEAGLREASYLGDCSIVNSEVESIELGLALSEPGELLVLLAHVEREEVETWLAKQRSPRE